ncbi:MAG TPA: FAD-dependent oxidoreductase, partial [Catenuloplanes sp.]
RLHRLVRSPLAAPGAALVPVGTAVDRVRLGLLAARCATVSPARLLAEPETSTETALRRAGLSHRIIEELLRPFLSGVFADRALETSSHVFAVVLRSFARGRIGVPASGMGALAAAVAAPLPPTRLVTDCPATTVGQGLVRTAAGDIRCRAVLVATDPVTAATLLPGALPAPRMRALHTYYHAAPVPPLDEPILLLDGDRREIIANTVVISNAAPSYAPGGRSLISTSVVGPDAPPEPVIRAELARLYGRATADWEHLTTVALPQALPAAPSPQGRLRQPVVLGDGMFVAGDHRDSPSIQGALASGWRAAAAIIAGVAPAPGPSGRGMGDGATAVRARAADALSDGGATVDGQQGHRS